jgi:hypothetical protein
VWIACVLPWCSLNGSALAAHETQQTASVHRAATGHHAHLATSAACATANCDDHRAAPAVGRGACAHPNLAAVAAARTAGAEHQHTTDTIATSVDAADGHHAACRHCALAAAQTDSTARQHRASVQS